MPYSSEAQRKYFNANREKLEAEGVDVDEWNQSTKGKKLPLKAKKEEPKSKLSKNAQNDTSFLPKEIKYNNSNINKPIPGAKTFKGEINRWYDNAGGFNNAVDKAQVAQRNRNTSVLGNSKWPKWSPQQLDNKINVTMGPHWRENFGVRGTYTPSIGTLRSPSIHLSNNSNQALLEHEISHSVFNPSISNTIKGIAFGANDAHSNESPGTGFLDSGHKRYISDPGEVDVRLAEIKRRYAKSTGKLVTNPQEAQEAWSWWKQNSNSNPSAINSDNPNDNNSPTMHSSEFEYYDNAPENIKKQYFNRMPELVSNSSNNLNKVSSEDVSTSFLPDYTPDQLKEMGVYKEVYGSKEAPRLASLPEWPEHWYNEADPHGWLQWYDRHSKGRRIEDDKRQIKRWISFKARHGGKAFKENPTPRRAFALRNWGIDPAKLVDDPESLKAVMDEYKEKQYSKKMEKVSFLPKSAKDGSNLKPNSFLPKTGAIMTPTSRRSADAFYNLADNVSQKKYDPMKGLDTYIQDGSNLMSEKLMGKKMSPVDIVKLVRKSGLASAITGDFDLMKWDPKSQAHYDAFSSGPVSAYSQFLKEKNIDNDSVWRDSSEKLTPSLSDKMAPGFAISKATGRAPWGYAARVRDTASRGADLYEPVGRQTYRDPIKRDMLTGDSMDKVWQTATSLSSPLNPGKTMTDINNELSKYVGTSDHNSIPTEGQTRMYPKFDNYLKWRNPNLHSKKQIIDFDNGMVRVPDAVTSYKPLISAVSFLDDTLYPANQNMIAKQ
jgi:hypothetical protein